MRSVLILLFASSCAHAGPVRAPAPAETTDDGAMSLFAAHRVEGAFVLRDLDSGATTVVNAQLASAGALPCSTFKIPNTLIGLDTGVIDGEGFALKWDGVQRPIAAWNRDHDLRSAMEHSVVWFYQEVARRIGGARMQAHVDAFAYGNRDTSAGIDRFWLEGPMRITPREQVDFLVRLRARALPVAPAHQALVERILPRSESGAFVMRAKTGLGEQDGRAIGWLVGFVDEGARHFAFATFVRGGAANDEELSRVKDVRHPLTRSLLSRHHAWQ